MDVLVANLQKALDFRQKTFPSFFEEPHHAAFRLFHGFSEGNPEFVVDLYGKTLVIYPSHFENNQINTKLNHLVNNFYLGKFDWLDCTVIKPRSRSGKSYIQFGSIPDSKIFEYGIWYSVDLRKHQDSTFYLDTRNLRHWLSQNVSGKTVLNTFAYTGSLGAAAYFGGANLVVQTDMDQTFLEIAKQTCILNKFTSSDQNFIAGDFFSVVAEFKRSGTLFDCVILDPPFFSKTTKGGFDLNYDYLRLVNKIRPLVGHNGILICVNNALYVSGKSFLRDIETICHGGYAKIAEIINCPADVIGPIQAHPAHLPADPAPFNHSTKIVVLKIERKDKLSPNIYTVS